MKCPECKQTITKYRNPFLTVDIIIECTTPDNKKGIILIHRKNRPEVWAIPGGFVDYGESVEEAASREALEETSLKIEQPRQFHCYSEPSRDPRQHNVSIVFIARATGKPEAGDDANDIGLFHKNTIPDNLGFDHNLILNDYFSNKYRIVNNS